MCEFNEVTNKNDEKMNIESNYFVSGVQILGLSGKQSKRPPIVHGSQNRKVKYYFLNTIPKITIEHVFKRAVKYRKSQYSAELHQERNSNKTFSQA